MEPAWLALGHPCHASGLVIVTSLGVAERGTASNVNDHKDDEDDNVQDGDLAPALLDAGKDARLARVTPEAKRLLVVAPLHTVRLIDRDTRVLLPKRLIHVCECT